MSKKILGFDVGIKNLAYCTIELDDKNYKILNWGIINLDDDRKLCNFTLRTKKPCNKTAFSSFIDDNKVEHLLCKTHSKKHEPEKVDLEKIEKNNTKCCFSLENIQCVKDACYKLKENYYCSVHGKKELSNINRETKVKKLASQSCGSIPILVLTKKLCKKLDEHPDFLQVDEVLIENQPSMLNPKMKTISSILYSYFTINGIANADKNKSTISNVKFNAPSNKLKVNKEGTIKILSLASVKKEEYDYTKELGIRYCKELIKHDEINLNLLDKEDKKDDLCDAFLHAFQYYYNNKKLLSDKKNDLDIVVDVMFKEICSKKNISLEEALKTAEKKLKKTKN
jgi:chaperonin cofactor prefoldin